MFPWGHFFMNAIECIHCLSLYVMFNKSIKWHPRNIEIALFTKTLTVRMLKQHSFLSNDVQYSICICPAMNGDTFKIKCLTFVLQIRYLVLMSCFIYVFFFFFGKFWFNHWDLVRMYACFRINLFLLCYRKLTTNCCYIHCRQ